MESYDAHHGRGLSYMSELGDFLDGLFSPVESGNSLPAGAIPPAKTTDRAVEHKEEELTTLCCSLKCNDEVSNPSMVTNVTDRVVERKDEDLTTMCRTCKELVNESYQPHCEPVLCTSPALSKVDYESMPPLPLLNETPTSFFQVRDCFTCFTHDCFSNIISHDCFSSS
jgi:hypothetical protein